jgi:aryl-alcohol dehydrogenase-like predicted oxidoreductase
MQYRPLGKTRISASRLAFGAGPISTLMIGSDGDRQRRVVEHALAQGINWFDTAATYGSGQSESNLGRVLEELDAADRVHVATKMRLMPEDLGDIREAVRRSFEASLQRLRLPRVTLLQLHNSITERRGDEPTSITPHDVLDGGVARVFEDLHREGLVMHLGLTGIGQPAAMADVVRSGVFATMQVPYHLLNPSAGRLMPSGFAEANYGNIIAECDRQRMGVLAIRVLAGGALAGNAPSPHTLKTPFFPLALYERDQKRAAQLQAMLGPQCNLPRAAIRFALAHPQIHTAIIGFGSIAEIDQAVQALAADDSPLDYDALEKTLWSDQPGNLTCE